MHATRHTRKGQIYILTLFTCLLYSVMRAVGLQLCMIFYTMFHKKFCFSPDVLQFVQPLQRLQGCGILLRFAMEHLRQHCQTGKKPQICIYRRI